MLDQRRKWIKTRFGRIDESILGRVDDIDEIKYSQMSVERAGYVPMGCFIGKRIYGGLDNQYYRHTLIHYAKLYTKGKKHLQNWDSMFLTEKAAHMVDTVRENWGGEN